MKGVGRVCQQTCVDTCRKVAHARLYPTGTPITAADMPNDRGLPFHEEHDLPVLRIMTDRGTEYCGRVDKHDFRLFLAINDIDHTKTKVKSPRTNGIRERFHKTVLQEFYQVAFPKNSMTALMRFRPIRMNGCVTTITSALIRAKCVAAERRSRP